MPTSLHQRIALLIVLATLLAVGITVALNYEATRRTLLTTAQNAFIRDLQSRVNTAAPALTEGADASAAVRRAQLRVGDDTIIEAYGLSAWSYSRPEEVPQLLRSTVEKSGVGTYYERTVHDGRPQLVVAIVSGFAENSAARPMDRVVVYGFRDLSDQQKQLTSMITTAAWSTLAVVVLVAGLGYLASRRLTAPLRALDDATKQLSEGHFTTVDVPTRSTDETARLTRSFNDAAMRLDELVTDLQYREASSRQFAEDVAHELRTPLAAMLAVVEVLEDSADGTEDAATAQATRTTVRETRRLATLVENLLEVSRPEEGDAAAMAPRMVDVSALVRAVLAQRGMLDTVDFVADPGAPATTSTMVDPRRIDLIVANLVTNAREHGAAPIEVSVWGTDDAIVVRVRDHGVGVSDADRARIFDRFFKADTSRGRTAGSGLGLSIAARNARLHGGRLTLTPDRTHTEFLLELPRREDDR